MRSKSAVSTRLRAILICSKSGLAIPVVLPSLAIILASSRTPPTVCSTRTPSAASRQLLGSASTASTGLRPLAMSRSTVSAADRRLAHARLFPVMAML